MGQRFTKEFCSGRGAAGREVAPPALDLGKATSETSPTQPGDSPALLQAAPAPEPKQEAAEPAVPEPEPKLEAAPAPEPKQEALGCGRIRCCGTRAEAGGSRAGCARARVEARGCCGTRAEARGRAVGGSRCHEQNARGCSGTRAEAGAEPAVPEPEPKPEAALASEPKQEAAEPAVPEPEPKPEAALAPEPKQEATEPAVQEPEPKREGELLEAADAMNSMPEAKAKGKGKGKGKPPPPAPKAKPKGAPKAAPKVMPTAGCGMSELLKRVEAIGEKDREESKAWTSVEIEDIDLSQIDPSAARLRVKCPRCEKEVLEEYLQSHMTAHSSEILPWLFLGGKRNLDNDVELTVRTGITHVLNLANDVTPINDAHSKERIDCVCVCVRFACVVFVVSFRPVCLSRCAAIFGVLCFKLALMVSFGFPCWSTFSCWSSKC
ncbi:unnamed protein product [Effrenium voratum]|nr:unnamed protein product [Effrenium voratum]